MTYKIYYLNNRQVDFAEIEKYHKLVRKETVIRNKELDKPNKVNEYYYE